MIKSQNSGTPDETGLYLERVNIRGIVNIAHDIADRLRLRHRLGGKEYIITEQPDELLVAVQKQWARLTQQMLKQRRSATDTEAIIELSRQITYMQNLKFTGEPFEDRDARIVATTYESAIGFPPACYAMYVIVSVTQIQLQALTSQMSEPSHIVVYRQETS